jgi:hypothetical protein
MAKHLAQNSVALSSQKSYQSAWNKWEKFLTKYFSPQLAEHQYAQIQESWLLERLIMFVTYCATELKCNVRSIPQIMSALRHCMVARFVKCCKVFDDDLLKNVKHGISQLPAPAHRTRLPCTLDMINYIVNQNTSPTASMAQVMLATGIYMAFFLCLRSSEYISKTVVPLADTHQFLTSDVEFALNDNSMTLVPSNQLQHYDYNALKIVKFSMLHAKNIRNDFGVPIWFSTVQNEQPVPFVHLVYLWSKHSLRLDSDPFLSYRNAGILKCLLYSDIQKAVKSAAKHFGLSEQWFNTHSVRMSAPTIAIAAQVPMNNVMRMGRWRSVPSAVLYQEQSTVLNNTILSLVSDRSLFTSDDIKLSRLLASRHATQPDVRRFY